jgi:glucokinase
MKAFAGIDLGGTNIKFGIIDQNGDIIIYRTIPAFAADGARSLLERLKICGEELLLYCSDNDLKIPYLGVGSPGTVNSDTGTILGHSPNIPGWEGTEVARELGDYLNLPVFVGNDANLMAVAEVIFGAARGCKNVICTTIGTGIGGALIVNGALLTGNTYSAGEFGHVPIIKDGNDCSCGLKGCLEPYASAAGLLGLARELGSESTSAGAIEKRLKKNDDMTVKELFTFYKKSDPTSVLVVETQADYMASGLAGLVNLLNPEIVVIGGGVADAGGVKYIRLIEKFLKARCLADSIKSLRVVKAMLGNKAGFIGAAIQREELSEAG